MGMAAAAAVYPLGWFDAAMVHGGEGWVLGDICCCMCWCGLYVICMICTVPLVRRESPFLPASKAF